MKLYKKKKKRNKYISFFWAHRSRQPSGVFNDAHLVSRRKTRKEYAKESMAEITSCPRGEGLGFCLGLGLSKCFESDLKENSVLSPFETCLPALPGWLRADNDNQDIKYVCVCDRGGSAAEAIFPS